MNSNNPFINRAFNKSADGSLEPKNPFLISTSDEIMTVQGTINKSFIMLGLLVLSAYFTWNYFPLFPFSPNVVLIGSGIIGFVLVLVSVFKPITSPYIAPAYAIIEGVFVGGISLFFNQMYPGIVVNAVGATMVTFLTMFLLYKTGVIKATEKFRSVIIGATMAIAAFYLMNLILYYGFDIQPISQGNSWLSIGISAVVVVVAALNLILDFDTIEQGAEIKMPKYMEWYSAIGLMITLIWLYLEILRLLSKLSSRD